MGSYSIGEALKLLMERSHWKPKIYESRIRGEWEKISGKTISKYTKSLNLHNKTLTITTDIGPLKHELNMGKDQLKAIINKYYDDNVVEEIIIK